MSCFTSVRGNNAISSVPSTQRTELHQSSRTFGDRERWVEEKMGSDISVKCVDGEIGLAWSVLYIVTSPYILTNYTFYIF
jgi:hypothetical protein